MLIDILKDIISRADIRKAVLKFVIGIVALIAVIVALKAVWNYYDVKHLENIIEDQKNTIEHVVDTATREKEKADTERITNEQSTKDLVEHIDSQNKAKDEFGSLRDNIAKFKSEPEQEQVTVTVPTLKDKPLTHAKPVLSQPAPKSPVKYSEDLRAIQSAVFDAYEKALAMSQ